MIKLCILFVTVFFISSCSNNFWTIGLVNNQDKEIIIETRPNIRYNGSPEKYIGLEKDSSNRGLVWKFGTINAIIVYPTGHQPAFDSMGIYIMKPRSGFQIGHFYKPDDKEFSDKCIDLDYLKVMTADDTLIFQGKEAIWNATNYDKRKKRNRKIPFEKALVFN
jgi:hypothetical protein